jgi:flagellar hook-length control protein FliK
MSNLPIKINSSPANITLKPGKTHANNQADTHEFGDVLARQRTDSVSAGKNNNQDSAKPSSTANVHDKKQKTEKNIKDNASADASADSSTNTQPANILESLLAQPNQTATPVDSAQVADISTQRTPLKIATANISTGTGKPELPGAIAASLANPSALSLATAQATPTNTADAIAAATAGIEAGNKSVKKDIISASVLPLAKIVSASATPEIELDKILTAAEQTGKDQKGFAAALQNFTTADIRQTDATLLQHTNPASELNGNSLQSALSSSLPSATAPQSALSVNTPIAHAAWADEFSQKITWVANQHMQSAELHLNPPQLGPLDVVLKMHGDQATATFTSPHAAVREAIEQAMPKLREMLADSGIMLGNAMVFDQPAYKQQDGFAQQTRSKAKSADLDTEIPAITESKISTIRRQQGMVDTFA